MVLCACKFIFVSIRSCAVTDYIDTYMFLFYSYVWKFDDVSTESFISVYKQTSMKAQEERNSDHFPHLKCIHKKLYTISQRQEMEHDPSVFVFRITQKIVCSPNSCPAMPSLRTFSKNSSKVSFP